MLKITGCLRLYCRLNTWVVWSMACITARQRYRKHMMSLRQACASRSDKRVGVEEHRLRAVVLQAQHLGGVVNGLHGNRGHKATQSHKQCQSHRPHTHAHTIIFHARSHLL